MFQIKVAWVERREYIIDLILGSVVKVRSRSHPFFKMDHHIFDFRI